MTFRRTKIVATLGPASSSPEVLEQLILAGLDVARLNFSHGTHEYHEGTINNVRAAAKEFNKPIAIALDTKGPEIRSGILKAVSDLTNSIW